MKVRFWAVTPLLADSRRVSYDYFSHLGFLLSLYRIMHQVVLSAIVFPSIFISVTLLTCAVMFLRTRYVVLASLCLIVKLGCIALLGFQATAPPSRHSTTLFFSPFLFFLFSQFIHTHAGFGCMQKPTSVPTIHVHWTSGISLPSV